MVKKQLTISFLGRKMFLSVSSEKDQIHTFQEAVFFVNNTLKATGLLNIVKKKLVGTLLMVSGLNFALRSLAVSVLCSEAR